MMRLPTKAFNFYLYNINNQYINIQNKHKYLYIIYSNKIRVEHEKSRFDERQKNKLKKHTSL